MTTPDALPLATGGYITDTGLAYLHMADNIVPRPDVSVLIPAYNAELTLARAVRSALDQPGVNVQVVIVDDASTDSTYEVARSVLGGSYVPKTKTFVDKDRRVKVVQHNFNVRIAGTLNTAAESADYARYIIRCDSDDYLERGCLARMVAALDANDDIGFVYGQRKYYGRRSDTYTPRPFNADDLNVHNAAGYCYMFRREIWDAGLRWRALGTFGGRVIDLEDWQHLHAMMQMGYKGMSMPDTLVLHYTFGYSGTWQELKNNEAEALAELKSRYPSVRAASL